MHKCRPRRKERPFQFAMKPSTTLLAPLLTVATWQSATAVVRLWQQVNIDGIYLFPGQSAEVQTKSQIYCASYATSTPWADLFCYEEGLCIVYDFQWSVQNTAPLPITSCWTIQGRSLCMDFSCFATSIALSLFTSLTWSFLVLDPGTVYMSRDQSYFGI